MKAFLLVASNNPSDLDHVHINRSEMAPKSTSSLLLDEF
jgi:hypothetical protein